MVSSPLDGVPLLCLLPFPMYVLPVCSLSTVKVLYEVVSWDRWEQVDETPIAWLDETPIAW